MERSWRPTCRNSGSYIWGSVDRACFVLSMIRNYQEGMDENPVTRMDSSEDQRAIGTPFVG